MTLYYINIILLPTVSFFSKGKESGVHSTIYICYNVPKRRCCRHSTEHKKDERLAREFHEHKMKYLKEEHEKK